MFSSHMSLFIASGPEFQITKVTVVRPQLQMNQVYMLVHFTGGCHNQLRAVGTLGSSRVDVGSLSD